MPKLNPAPRFKELPPLSLYIHIPWCAKKCPYCDFNSHAVGPELPEEDYIKALLEDLDNDLDFIQGRALRSIFFGGGTPSLFSAKGIGQLLSEIEKKVTFAEDIEITLEANPGTFEQQKFADLRLTGINRLSIGIQSFNDLHLQRLGRIHNGSEASKAIGMAQKAGFDNFNLDLMHGLPGQTAIAFAPQHVSWYQLTIEANTEFYKKPPQLPDDESRWLIFEQGQALLAAQGYQQYEVSAYSRPGKASLHNLNYWQFGDYLGIGAGAHGKITELAATGDARIIRTRKTRTPKDYMNKASTRRSSESIANEDIAGEFIMNALRLNQGFSAQQFSQYSGLAISEIAAGVETAVKRELLTVSATEQFQPTAKGRLFLDDLVALFIFKVELYSSIYFCSYLNISFLSHWIWFG